MHRLRSVGTCLAVVLALGVGACSGSPPSATVTGTTSPSTIGTVEPVPTSILTPAPSTTSASTTSAPTASALGDLAAFLDAARELDARLHAATPLINASIETDAVVVDGPTAAAVQAIDYGAVTSAIPAGMPPELMRQVGTVYSDLVSRTLAVRRFSTADRTYSRIPADGEMGLSEGEEMVACLANGTEAAHRFDADLSAVVATGGSTPPLPTLEPTSLAHPELQAQLQEIVLRNGGCGACGGYVATRSSSIVWGDADASATTRTGMIVDEPAVTGTAEGSGATFTATYSPGSGWTVDINAC